MKDSSNIDQIFSAVKSTIDSFNSDSFTGKSLPNCVTSATNDVTNYFNGNLTGFTNCLKGLGGKVNLQLQLKNLNKRKG
jgi:phage-related protein